MKNGVVMDDRVERLKKKLADLVRETAATGVALDRVDGAVPGVAALVDYSRGVPLRWGGKSAVKSSGGTRPKWLWRGYRGSRRPGVPAVVRSARCGAPRGP